MGTGNATGSRVEPRAALHLRSQNVKPGTVEKWLAGVTLAVFAVGIPTKWGFSPNDADPSNPLLTLARVVLPSVMLLRVLGSLDSLVAAIRTNLYPLALALFAFASLFWSDDPPLSAQKGLELLLATAFAYYLVMRFEPRDLLRLVVTVGFFLALLHLAFVFGLPGRGRSPAGFTGVHREKNALGRDAAIQIILLLFAHRIIPSWRPLVYAGLAANIFLLAGTESMTSTLALGLTLGLWPVFFAFRARRTMPGVVLFGVLGSGLLALFAVTANLGRLTAALGKDITFTGRTSIWTESLPVALQRPLFGWGFEAAFTGYFGPLHEAFIVAGWRASHAHNAVLQIFIELGAVGLILYVAFYLASFRSSIRVCAVHRNAISMFPLVILTFGVLMSITEIGPQSSPYAWVLTVYVGVAASRGAALTKRDMAQLRPHGAPSMRPPVPVDAGSSKTSSRGPLGNSP